MSSASRSAAAACCLQLSSQFESIYPGFLSHSPIPAHSAVSFGGVHANNTYGNAYGERKREGRILIGRFALMFGCTKLTAVFVLVLSIDAAEDHDKDHNRKGSKDRMHRSLFLW